MSKIAIIGSGIAGLGCAHFLLEAHDITVFEAGPQAGGHAHTQLVPGPSGPIPVDTAFLFFNRENYPHFMRLLDQLQVPTREVPFSFSLRDETLDREWAGPAPARVVRDPRNFLNPRVWRMLPDMLRFAREVEQAAQHQQTREMSLLQYLTRQNYSEEFIRDYVMPLSSAVWTTPPEIMLELPASGLFGYLRNHGLYVGAPQNLRWLTIPGGSQRYVEKLCARLKDRLRLGCAVHQVSREAGRGVYVHLQDSLPERFDRVIIATHADMALKLLGKPTQEEHRLLSEFRYQPNLSVIHADPRVMPKRRRHWSTWNLSAQATASGQIIPSTHYWLHRIQATATDERLFLSLTRPDQGSPENLLHSLHYEHPVPNLWAKRAQGELPGLNVRALGQTETFFVGSYFKNGFHEDALMRALHLCEFLLGRDPWGSLR